MLREIRTKESVFALVSLLFQKYEKKKEARCFDLCSWEGQWIPQKEGLNLYKWPFFCYCFVFDSLQSRPCQILREARSYFLLCCHHIPRFEQLIINLTTLILLGRVFMP